MRIKEGFVLRNIAGEFIVVGEGLDQINFNKMISLNETAAYLWQNLEGIDFSVETMAELLQNEYDVDPTLANNDSAELAKQWLEVGIICE